MGSELIVIFIPLMLPCIAYFVYRLCPSEKRLRALIAVVLVLVASIALIAYAGGTVEIFLVVIGVLLFIATVLHGATVLVGAGFKKICLWRSRT
jgi:hypothetical protein